MQFNSFAFIFFFPISILLYFAANRLRPELGKLVIIGSGIAFCALGKTNMLLFLGGSILINYCAVLLIRKYSTRNKLLLALPILINLGLLFSLKYLDFAIRCFNLLTGTHIRVRDILLPLGISFYTFQQIAYIVATISGELKNNSLIDYLTFILYFPKLVMGPLADPVDFIAQINETSRKKANYDNIASGLMVFSFGLLKKTLLADTFAAAVTWVYTNLGIATAVDCLLVMLFYTFEIYFDFGGYSDMAIGISTMMNIDLPMNFRSPYLAVSIRDFWKRWHLTLTRFLTRDVFVPLGGSRKGLLRTCVNTLIVFVFCGMWHGSKWSFVLWGILHGLLSCFDRVFGKLEEKIPKPIRWLFTFAVLNVLWLLFSTQSIQVWRGILMRIMAMQTTAVSGGLMDVFNVAEITVLYRLLGLDGLTQSVPWFNMVLFFVAAAVVCVLPENCLRVRKRAGIAALALSSLAFIWGVLCIGAESVFIYSAF